MVYCGIICMRICIAAAVACCGSIVPLRTPIASMCIYGASGLFAAGGLRCSLREGRTIGATCAVCVSGVGTEPASWAYLERISPTLLPARSGFADITEDGSTEASGVLGSVPRRRDAPVAPKRCARFRLAVLGSKPWLESTVPLSASNACLALAACVGSVAPSAVRPSSG